MEEKVLSILCKVLEDNNLTTNCSQQNCDSWDSLHHLNICFELEGEFGVMFEPDEMIEMNSFENIIKILNKKLV